MRRVRQNRPASSPVGDKRHDFALSLGANSNAGKWLRASATAPIKLCVIYPSWMWSLRTGRARMMDRLALLPESTYR
jgi:hypothetical protein